MYQFFIGKTFNSVEGKGEAKAEVSDINSGSLSEVSFRFRNSNSTVFY